MVAVGVAELRVGRDQRVASHSCLPHFGGGRVLRAFTFAWRRALSGIRGGRDRLGSRVGFLAIQHIQCITASTSILPHCTHAMPFASDYRWCRHCRLVPIGCRDAAIVGSLGCDHLLAVGRAAALMANLALRLRRAWASVQRRKHLRGHPTRQTALAGWRAAQRRLQAKVMELRATASRRAENVTVASHHRAESGEACERRVIAGAVELPHRRLVSAKPQTLPVCSELARHRAVAGVARLTYWRHRPLSPVSLGRAYRRYIRVALTPRWLWRRLVRADRDTP